MKEVRGWHELAHKINYAHRVIRDLLSSLPATEQYKSLREAGVAFKVEAESSLIITPSQILNENNQGG